jgi:ribosome-associated protein
VPASPEAVALAVAAAEGADDRRAVDPVILDVADLLAIADLFLVCSATNERQVGAIVDGIEERLHRDGRRPLRREGTPSSGWMLLDYGDLICHVLHEEQRDFYALERLWADVPRRDPLTGEILPIGTRATGSPTTSASVGSARRDAAGDTGSDRP